MMTKTYDMGPGRESLVGVAGARFTSADATTIAAVTDAPPAGQHVVVDDIIVTSNDAVDLVFTEETSGTVKLPDQYMSANDYRQITPRGKLKLPTAAKRLMVQAALAGEFDVLVIYHFEG